jgi:tRNA pseudouridine55 synthase
VVAEKPLPEDLSEEAVRKEMDSFLGDQYQIPPMFSAKKIGGVPLYKLARKGKTVEREPRFIRINKFETLRFELPEIDFRMASSKGTYVRTVAHDLGQRFDCGAHLTALRRTLIDQFELKDGHTLEAIEEGPLSGFGDKLIPVHRAVPTHAL